MKKISVIINTLNRALELEKLLQSLYYLNYPDFEVIVVNGPSVDNTKEILDKYKQDIKVAYCSEANLSISRNIGISNSSGDYIAFIDDDAIPDPDWLNNLMLGFGSNEVAGVGGPVYDKNGINYEFKNPISNRFAGGYDTAFAFPYTPYYRQAMGGNSLYNKQIIIDIGGFNEHFAFSYEEIDLCARLFDAGYVINYADNAPIYHKSALAADRRVKSNVDKEKLIICDYTKTIKSAVYFIKQYEDVAGNDMTSQAIQDIITYHKVIVENNYKKKLFNKATYDSIHNTINLGLEQGLELAAIKSPLIFTKNLLAKNNSKYKKFPNFATSIQNKKTIVILTNDYPPIINGGVTILAHNMAKFMAKQGHRVHVITCDDYKYDNPSVTFEDNVWVHRVTVQNHNIDQLKLDFLQDMDFNKTLLRFLNQSYSVYKELCSIAEKCIVDIVHTAFWQNLNLYSLYDLRFTNVLLLITPGAYFKETSIEYLRLEKFVIENTPNIVADSRYIYDFCKSYYPKVNSQYKLCYLGLEDKSKEPITILDNSNNIQDTIEVLFVGRLELRKGIDTLLSCIPRICQQFPNVIFRIVGPDGSPPNVVYKTSFVTNPIAKPFLDRVIFEGHVQDTSPYFANCDIFIAPSRFESFGLIYIEAMMFGKPSIGCKVSAISEVVNDGVTGLLAEPGNVESLEKCLVRLIQDKELREQLGKAGRKKYIELFTVDKMVNNLLMYYDNILSPDYHKN